LKRNKLIAVASNGNAYDRIIFFSFIGKQNVIPGNYYYAKPDKSRLKKQGT